MSDPQTTKMLQAILSGQTALKQELVSRIDKVYLKVDGLGGKVDKLDKIGKQLAYLEDDTPTREEFDRLEKRVDSLSPTL